MSLSCHTETCGTLVLWWAACHGPPRFVHQFLSLLAYYKTYPASMAVPVDFSRSVLEASEHKRRQVGGEAPAQFSPQAFHCFSPLQRLFPGTFVLRPCFLLALGAHAIWLAQAHQLHKLALPFIVFESPS